MKNAAKIRQLLKSFEWIHIAFHETDYFCPSCKRSKEDGHYKNCHLKEALALLPCETCNGTGRIPTPRSMGFGKTDAVMDSCPDCQPICETCKGKGTIFAPKGLTGMCVTLSCPDCQS